MQLCMFGLTFPHTKQIYWNYIGRFVIAHVYPDIAQSEAFVYVYVDIDTYHECVNAMDITSDYRWIFHYKNVPFFQVNISFKATFQQRRHAENLYCRQIYWSIDNIL